MSNWTPTVVRRVCELLDDARIAARAGNHGIAHSCRERGAGGPDELVYLIEDDRRPDKAMARAYDELVAIERACLHQPTRSA